MKTVSKESFLGLQRFTKFYVSKWYLPLVLILGLVFILLPNTLRDNPFMIGDESFYHLRIAQNVLDEGYVNYDELSFSGRNNFMELGLSYIIAGVSYITKLSIESSAKYLFALLGVISLFLGYLILKHFDAKEGLFTLPVIFLSPPFIYLFSVVNKVAIPISLSLLAIYLLLKKRYYLSALPLLAIPFFNYAFTIFILISFLIIWLYIKKRKVVILILLILLLGWIFSLDGNNFKIISDFGSELGVSIFGIFILLFGISVFWKKQEFPYLYFLVLLLFIASIKIRWIIFILIIPFSFLVTLNLSYLIKMKWESGLIKDLTVLLLICGLLFSGVSSANFLSEEGPDKELFDALSNIPIGSVVLSHQFNGYWINYAGMKTVIGPFTNIDNYDERKEDVKQLFESRDLSLVKSILDKYNVDYILITPDMRNGFIWSDDEEGVLFLLKYSAEDFERFYDKDLDSYKDVEIWKYNKK